MGQALATNLTTEIMLRLCSGANAMTNPLTKRDRSGVIQASTPIPQASKNLTPLR